jgi:Ca-activated chloride channel family protein
MEFKKLLHLLFRTQNERIMKTILTIIAVLTIMVTVFAGNAQTITGKVTDEKMNPLHGVTVAFKNSRITTTTDLKGEYKIAFNGNDQWLVFSLVGKETLEVKIDNQLRIDVVLKAKSVTEKKSKQLEIVECREMAIGYTAASAVQCISMSAPMMDQEFNTENYSAISENGFKNPMNQPLSTFSIDVDNASYSNIRRFINMGQLPPKDAVRIEEMINYFDFDYKQPIGDKPFAVSTEIATCPWNSKHNVLMVGLQGKEVEKSTIPPSNLVFLLDVSGSMNAANKLPLVKSAMRMLVDELRPQDKVSIVVYAGAAGLVLDATPGTNKKKILDALENLSAGGSTAGGEGLRLAYKVAGENLIEKGNNRIILATDGDFNVGISSDSEMEKIVSEEKQRGIFITVLGFGMGNYKDNKLEIISDKGNGNYAYIDNIQEARKIFIKEFGGTLYTIAKDVKIQIEFNPEKVKAYRLIGYENRLLNAEDFKDDKKDAGEMGSGHQVTALYEIIPIGVDTQIPEVDKLKYQQQKGSNSNHNNEMATLKCRYKEPDGNNSIADSLIIKESTNKQAGPTSNFKLATGIAQFGMLLRDSEYKGNSTIDNTVELVKQGRGNDEEGYAGELIRLIESARSLGLCAH